MKATYIFATDGSDSARAAERYIIENLDAESVALTVVSVTEKLPPGLMREGESLTTDPETLRNQLTDQVRENAESARARLAEAGFDVDLSLLAGDPGQEICEYASKTDTDGIILARRGRGEVAELLIGSVSQYVLHHATVPVTIVPGTKET